MARRRHIRFVRLARLVRIAGLPLALLLLPWLAGPAGSQSPQASPSPSPPPVSPPPDQGVLAPAPDTGDIDEILEGEEEVLSGNGDFNYDPGNRRDPFKSLLASSENPAIRGPRPDGVPGLMVDEIDLLGIWRTPRGYVAQIKASNKSYLLKEGDQLFDGDVLTIRKDEVVFKQKVQDQTALKPFREVVKSLNPPQG